MPLPIMLSNTHPSHETLESFLRNVNRYLHSLDPTSKETTSGGHIGRRADGVRGVVVLSVVAQRAEALRTRRASEIHSTGAAQRSCRVSSDAAHPVPRHLTGAQCGRQMAFPARIGTAWLHHKTPLRKCLRKGVSLNSFVAAASWLLLAWCLYPRLVGPALLHQ